MFKLVAFVAMLAGACFASDIFDVKLACKATKIAHTDSTFYKDTAALNYNGFLAINYNDDGTVASADMLIYGNFADGKGTRTAPVDISVLNRIGKNLQKCQLLISTDFGDVSLTLSGAGTTKTVATKLTDCSDTCGDQVKIGSASGNIIGDMNGVVCDPCDGNSWAFEFNVCSSIELVESKTDSVYGNWSIRYNNSLTDKCVDVGFPACVMQNIPKAFLPAE